MTNRMCFAVPILFFATACGGDGPGPGPGNGTGPVTDPPSITSVSPDPLLEGASATIVGVNFSATSGANLVRIDGIQTVVTSASTTQLTVTVPRTCGAVRTGNVTVSVSSRTSAAVSVEIDPNAQRVNLAVGEQDIFRGQGTYCLELPPGDGAVQYLVGLQSTSEEGGTKTNARLIGKVGSSASLVPGPLPSSRLVSSGQNLPTFSADPDVRLYLRHRREHSRRLQRDMDFVESLGLPSPPRAAAVAEPAQVVVTGSEQVGDRVQLRILDHTVGGCTDFATITAELKIKTANAMWFVDVSNPQPGFSSAQLQSLADVFEIDVRQADEDVFGAPADLDGNGRVVIVITETLNANNGTQFGTVGFVNICDGFDRGGTITATNEGEFFYAVSPDEGNEHGQRMSIEFLLGFMPFLLAHEYAHVIQFSRRFADQAGASTFILMDSFEAEGQATLAEEIVGHSVLGNEPLQNYDGTLAWDFADVLPFPWYSNPFSDLAFFYGANTNTQSKVDGAPEECTWTQDSESAGDPDPCLSRASWYGVTWAFFRWVSDQVVLEGGDASAIHKALIDSRLDGFENLAAAFSELGTLDDLLAEWAASLYTDERIAGAPNPRLTFPSWDLVSVGSKIASWARLEPRIRTFSGFTDNITIRSPSMAYWVIEGSSNPVMTLYATSATGGALPSHIQMWVVRMR